MKKTNIFISFSFDQSNDYKNEIQKLLESKSYVVDYSEKEDRSEYSDETIWKYLLNRIKGSSVTLLIYSPDLRLEGNKGEDNGGWENAGWIYKELDATLRDWKENNINGLVLIVPDKHWNSIASKSNCDYCGKKTTSLHKNIVPTIVEKNRLNVKLKYKKDKCLNTYDSLLDSYITTVKLSEFKKEPQTYIENAKIKRQRQINNEEFDVSRGIHQN